MEKLKLIKSKFLTIIILAFCSGTVWSQNSTLILEPSELVLDVGGKISLEAKVVDDDGNELKDWQIRYFSRKSKAVSIDNEGNVEAYLPGEFSIIVLALHPSGDRSQRIRKDIPVIVKFPPLKEIVLEDIPSKIYAGTTIQIETKVIDEAGLERDVRPEFSTADPSIAAIDPFGNLTALKKGKTSISASIDNINNKININIVDNPVAEIKLSSNTLEARTGDVIYFEAQALDKEGNVISDVPVIFSFKGKAYDVSSSASGLIRQNGKFVADEPGLYTITASIGTRSANKTVNIVDRNVQRKVEFVGKGSVNTKHTSDFWVWEGVDGKDYAVTGTWGADGTAYFWDVTNPAEMKKIDSIQVDARTVNDVKVSEDGTICVISREGASNRKNGIVILDVTNPADVKIISTFTEKLTGGVHNLFIYKDHVYALSAGRKYYVVNIKEPENPKIVGEFELETPGHSIHDVWIEDGIAYSANWSDGVQLVDVGNGIAGGSPENPVQFASYAYPSGAHHATFPYRSKSTGKFYVIMGDEIFPYGLDIKGENIAAGFIHIVDFTDLENPVEVARYEVPGAGSHNFWVKDDILYVAFYNGGVRIVDLSGELMGDLYKQGREIGWIIPSDPDGYIPNAPFTWGAQPYKGHIFYSDWNSGLWAAKLEPEKPENTKVETK